MKMESGMNMLPNNENTNEQAEIELLRGQLACMERETVSLRIAIQNLADYVKELQRMAITDEERKALEGMLNTIMYEPNKIAIKSILSRF